MKYLLPLLFCFPAFADKIYLNRANTGFLNLEISPNTTDTMMGALISKRAFLDMDKTLYIIIACTGGEYDSAKVLEEFVNSLPNTVLICKYCASAASMIFIASKQPRYVMKSTEIVLHEMYLRRVTANHVKDKTWKDIANNLVNSSEEFNKSIYTRIGMKKDEYESMILNKDITVSGADLKRRNYSDKFVDIECDGYISILAPATCAK